MLRQNGYKFVTLPIFRKQAHKHNPNDLKKSGLRILEHIVGGGVAVFFDACKFVIGSTSRRAWIRREDSRKTAKDLGNDNVLQYELMVCHLIGVGAISATICQNCDWSV